MRLLLALALCGLAGCGTKTEPGGKADGPRSFDAAAELRKAVLGCTADEARKLLGNPDSIAPEPGPPGMALWCWDKVRVGPSDVPVELFVENGRVTRVQRVGDEGRRDGATPRDRR